MSLPKIPSFLEGQIQPPKPAAIWERGVDVAIDEKQLYEAAVLYF